MNMLTVGQVAERLQCSIANVYSLIEKKELGAFKVGANGGGLRVSDVMLEAFLESRREHPGKDAGEWPAGSKPTPRLTFKR
ncbi:MAG: helix-turn-helix domain-containing protein [Pirellulales bacterium]